MERALEPLYVSGPGVARFAFAGSISKRWTGLGVRVGVGLASAAVVGWGAQRGFFGLLVAAALLVGPILWVVSRPGWRTARRVVVSDRYLEATHCGGTRIRLAWDGVGEVQHFVRGRRRYPIRVLRLLSIDRQRDVMFDDRLPGFEQLMGLVEPKIRHVSSGTPSSWGRLLWPESRVGRDAGA